MPGEDDNTLNNFELYKDEESILEAQNIEKDHRDMVGKSSDNRNRAKAGRISQNGLLGSESSSSLREVRFSKQKYLAGRFELFLRHVVEAENRRDNLGALFRLACILT